MFSQTDQNKGLFAALEKATAATHKEDLKDGKPQNPLSAFHWTMENHGTGYKISIIKSGLVVGYRTFEARDMQSSLTDDKGKVVWMIDQRKVTELVQAMFDKISAKAA